MSALGVAVVMLAGCGPADPAPTTTAPTTPSTPKSTVPHAEAAARLAPVMWLAEGEENGPADATTHLGDAALKWAHDDGCGDDDIADPPDPGKLRHLTSPYEHQGKGGPPGCEHGGPTYQSTDDTRPHGTVLGAEGFYLDGDDDKRGGVGAAAPVYWQYIENKEKTKFGYVYWMFYPYNNARNVPSEIPIVGPGSVLAGIDYDHEGDWERVTVLTDKSDTPQGVTFNGHGHQCRLDWDEVEKSDGRPTAFSAKGTHASYPTVGYFGKIYDVTGEGERWDAAARLRPIETEPWWGYAGGWGSVGRPGLWAADRTGPAGPRPSRGPGDPWNAVPCDEGEPRVGEVVDESLVGTWRSTTAVDQPSTSKVYNAVITLRAGAVGTVVGESSYPELACSGPLRLIEAGPERAVLAEAIDKDPGSTCIKAGEVTLSVVDGGLRYAYQEKGGRVTATALLAKQ
ncbi:protein of unknown function [Actinokineospora alba]|uniref:LGFP repeat-containing protein n=2 Tax=Actinokineospora alba TaxID=504798 RepID=A0A1H0F988_9PSEU|nr:uncharacterized protein DUF946 [Actinokineospora alba]SDI17761.1 protein of unknown function [Actinokineospora alba]SDN91082.1 protein of unknown function [Actinokineospora alba]